MRARCQCRGLTADIAEDAEATIALCHCLDCQRRSGLPFGEIAYYPDERVAVDTLTDPAFPLPARSVYEQSKHHWIEMPAGVTRHPCRRTS